MTDDVVTRLAAVFGEPRTPDPELFLEEFGKAIKGWDDKVLHRAADEVICDCVYWPKPAELIERAQRIAAGMYRPKPESDQYAWRSDPDPESVARVNELVAKASLHMLGLGPRVDAFADTRKPLTPRSRAMMGDTE
jgi:hypothetical protein